MTASEQTVRQALIDSMPRQQVIAAIAQHLFTAATRGNPGTYHSTPRDWYAAPFATKRRQ